ncbi:MAG: hypothetical protein ABIS06_01425 [Vicinamibacterales bacterium]
MTLPAGASAIRGLSENGLEWTIDGKSPGADRIQAGKVLLVTSRASGRVLAVTKDGTDLRVILGPVEITDVVKEGSFKVEQPVDLTQSVPYVAPDLLNGSGPVAPVISQWNAGPYRLVPVRFGDVTVHKFKAIPLAGPRGVGARITSDAGSVKFLGEAFLYLNTPKLRFILDIRAGKITVCEVELSGAAGILLTFEAASTASMSANLNEDLDVPTSYSIPIVGMGVPFSVTFSQRFRVQTAFSSTGVLKARGNYSLNGGLNVGYRDGRFSVGGPTGLKTKESLLNSTDGVAIGVSGLVLVHQVKVMVGIGAFGFNTGPYVAMNSSVAVSRGSNIGIVTCKGATLTMALLAGVGYMMPQTVTRAINFILRKLNLGEIKRSGGFETAPMNILSTTSYAPKVKVCEQ